MDCARSTSCCEQLWTLWWWPKWQRVNWHWISATSECEGLILQTVTSSVVCCREKKTPIFCHFQEKPKLTGQRGSTVLITIGVSECIWTEVYMNNQQQDFQQKKSSRASNCQIFAINTFEAWGIQWTLITVPCWEAVARNKPSPDTAIAANGDRWAWICQTQKWTWGR